jgi:hypothetical protein
VAIKIADNAILVILQNAWGVEDGYIPDYAKDSFRNSYTGRRLKEMLPKNVPTLIRNSTPCIGRESGSWFPPDYEYIMGELEQLNYDVVLACGKNAHRVVNKVLSYALRNPPVVYAPHPAWRQLSKKITGEIRKEVQRQLDGLA